MQVTLMADKGACMVTEEVLLQTLGNVVLLARQAAMEAAERTAHLVQ